MRTRMWWAVSMALILSALASSPAAATNNIGNRWIDLTNGCYRYWVKFKWDSTMPTGTFRTSVLYGKGLWNSVGTELYFALDSNGSRIVVGYKRPGWPNQNVLAWAVWNSAPWWELHNGTIDFNPIYAWYTGTGTPPEGQYDVWTVAAAEFGHLVQLNHVTDTAPPIDIMYHTFRDRETRRALTSHDKAGLRQMYGAPWGC